MVRTMAVAFVLWLAGTSLAAPAMAQDGLESLRALASAYKERDPVAAGDVYAPDAEVAYRYAGVDEERYQGRDAIARSFAAFFARLDPAHALDLNFRVTNRTERGLVGFYRLRLGPSETSYGRFEVELAEDGRLLQDVSYSATRSEFEDALGELVVAPEDNDLDRSYYSLMTGRFDLADGCTLVVTRSVMRLLLRNTCTDEWRGLARISGREWRAGAKVLSDETETLIRFAPFVDLPSQSMSVVSNGAEVVARRNTPYLTEDVTFQSADGTELAGTLYLPSNKLGEAAQRPAVVIVHGSGPQDRDGYASIIAVMADEIAANGRVVLTFDKRGTGRSGGDWATAGFETLATDAIAAMGLLARRDDVDPDRIGLAGSSQAGWVVAEAIRQGAEPLDVFLLGAAGTAFTVAEQNLYNTRVRMVCEGLPSDSIDRAVAQQSAFFAALQDSAQAGELDRLTALSRTDANIADWLFPDSSGLDAEGQWFTVLAANVDPRPVWRDFGGRMVFVFSEFDDSTDTAEALRRLAEIGIDGRVLSGAQHIGLKAQDVCAAGLADSTGFSSRLFELLRDFAKAKPTDP